MTTREALHRYVDELPDEMLEAAEAALVRACDNPIIRGLYSVPIDDEPLTEEEREDLERAAAAIAAGDTISDDELDELFRE